MPDSNSTAHDKKQSAPPYVYKLRPSAVAVAVQLIMVHVLSATLIITGHSLMFFLNDIISSLIRTSHIIAVIFVFIVEFFIIAWGFYIIVNWLKTQYIITPKEITVERGIIRIKEEVYTTEHINEVNINQSIWARWFNYGTIRITSGAWKDDLFLRDIPDPELYVAVMLEGRSIEEIRRIMPFERPPAPRL